MALSVGTGRAVKLLEEGKFDGAREVLRAAYARNPDDLKACLLLVDLEDRMGDPAAAARIVDGLLDRAGDNAKLLFRRGLLAMRTDHQHFSIAGEAERFFTLAAKADPLMAEAHLHRGLMVRIQTKQAEAAPFFRRAALVDPSAARPLHELAHALHQAEELEAAMRCLRRALVADPSHQAARKDLEDLEKALRVMSRRPMMARFPHQLSMVADIGATVRRHVLDRPYPDVLRADSTVVTFGSCFAGNVARALREAGVTARNTTMGEFVNSTTANRYYIDWVVNGADNEITRGIVDYHAGTPDFSSDREEHRRSLAESDIVVMTVGVAPGFFRRGTDELVMPRSSNFNLRAMLEECEFRTTTVDQNVSNILFILDQVRRINPESSIVITVSPVPLTVSFEYPSAFIADCVSKSTLRVAVDQVMRHGLERLVYWPSFEIVRWLGAYAPGMYGDEDGSTLHVSERVIDLIVSTFIEELSGGRLAKPGRDA